MALNRKRWSERDTIKFVELYEVEEALWNINSECYKNKDARCASLRRILDSLDIPGLTVQDINNKINSIRATYAQEKLKIKKSIVTGSGAEDIYNPSIPWFEVADRFLCSVTKSRKLFQNVVDSNACFSDIASSPTVTPASSSPDIPSSPSPDIPHQVPNIPDSPSPNLPFDPPSIAQESTPFVKPSCRKRIKKTLPEHISKSIETLQCIRDQALNNREIEDEFYYFGKNIASQLRQLPILDALDVQSDILNLIKMKRQSNLLKQTNSTQDNSPLEYCTIEIPETIFLSQEEESSQPEPNDVLENDFHNIQGNNNLLEQAIRSIGGITSSQTPQE